MTMRPTHGELSQPQAPHSAQSQEQSAQPQSSSEQQTQQHRQNVGERERWLSMGAGALMALAGLQRRSLPGLLMAGLGGLLIKRGATGQCELYQMLGIDTAEPMGARPEDYFDHGIHVAESFTIARPPQELYAYWRNFENLPRIMRHLESVTVIDDKRSHWVAHAPTLYGGRVEWEAEIINDEPDYLIAWQSLPGADVHNAGSVRFIDAGERGTEVKVVIEYLPPAGRVGQWIASLTGQEPQQQIREDLQNFKHRIESGEMPPTETL